MQLYTIDEVAALFKCSKASIIRHIGKGHLDGIKVGRLWRFTDDQIDAYLKKRTVSRIRKKFLTLK